MALLHKNYLKSLVAIGDKNTNSFRCLATGFLIGFLEDKEKANSEDRRYHVFLLTNRHVLQNKEAVTLRFNTPDSRVKEFNIKLTEDNKTKWLAHPDNSVDLAMLTIDPAQLRKEGLDFRFVNEETFLYFKNFENTGLELGDDLFVIGFPMGISGSGQNYPYVKSGIVSRIDKEITEQVKAFIIDSSIFPGNSGGPVFNKPTLMGLPGSKAIKESYLVGVVSKYIRYTEKLYSKQTGDEMAILVENSGLTHVVPMDFALEIFKVWKKTNKELEETTKRE